MAKNYIKTTFFIDILATIPFDAVLMASKTYQEYKQRNKVEGNIQWVEILGMLKIGRVLRLNTMIQMLKSGEDVKAGLRILKITLFLIVYLHCLACLWWLLIKTDQVWIPVAYISSGNYHYIYQRGFGTQYLFSLHYSVQTMIGSDIYPRTSIQTAITSFCIFLGAIINANLFGELALLLAGINVGLKRFQMKINRANNVMINLKLPFWLQQEVRHHLT